MRTAAFSVPLSNFSFILLFCRFLNLPLPRLSPPPPSLFLSRYLYPSFFVALFHFYILSPLSCFFPWFNRCLLFLKRRGRFSWFKMEKMRTSCCLRDNQPLFHLSIVESRNLWLNKMKHQSYFSRDRTSCILSNIKLMRSVSRDNRCEWHDAQLLTREDIQTHPATRSSRRRICQNTHKSVCSSKGRRARDRPTRRRYQSAGGREKMPPRSRSLTSSDDCRGRRARCIVRA